MRRTFIGFDACGEKIRVSPKEWRAHMHVLGSSDTGKSKLLEWLMRGDLRDRQGFCLVDPHGTLYDAVAQFAAHHVLSRDLILLNLSRPDAIIGFNPFQAMPGVEISAQVDRRIAATLRAWNVKTTDTTPTLDRTLRLVYTIMIEQNLGLREANHLIAYQARDVRARLIERLQSPLVQKEWEELQKLNRKDWQEEVLSAKNRLFRLLSSETLSRFMGLPGRSLDLGDAIEKNKVILINLAASDSLSSDNARVFGALLVNELFEAAKRRLPDERGRDPAPYYLYIDEFQNFVTHDIGDMLDQVRKRGLYAILAQQRFGQLDENIIDAALANCHIKAVFGGLPVQTARRMAEELFIGKLDPRRVKAAIYQTKFWPQYSRDTVYTSGRTRARAHAQGWHTASSTSESATSGAFFGPEEWFGGAEPEGAKLLRPVRFFFHLRLERHRYRLIGRVGIRSRHSRLRPGSVQGTFERPILLARRAALGIRSCSQGAVSTPLFRQNPPARSRTYAGTVRPALLDAFEKRGLVRRQAPQGEEGAAARRG